MMRSTPRRSALAIALCATLVAGCDGDTAAVDDERAAPTQARSPYTGRSDVAEQMRTAVARVHSPLDGTGRAWIESGPATVTVGSLASWSFVYEVGDDPIAANSRIIFMVSPFWGWSPPQHQAPGAPGYATARTDAAGVTLSTETNGSPMMAISIAGRELRPGERVVIEYGGSVGARTDRFAEAYSYFWIGVDGDGDGSHRFLDSSPAVEVVPGRPARMVAIAPSTVNAEQAFALRVAILDRNGSAGVAFNGSIQLESVPPGLAVPAQVELTAEHQGRISVPLVGPEQGVFRLRVTTPSGFETTSNPIVVTPPGAPRIFWGDLHGHSGLSDGTGTPEDYFRYARDIAALDVVSLTDHDHWGVLHIDQHPEMWAAIQDQTRAFHRPGEFVTLLGYEWTSWEYGHRHVLYFSDAGTLYSSIDLDFNTPDELWTALRGRDAITVAHHSAGGPIGTDWSFAPDPEIEPITEVVSVHGVSEAPDSPSTIYNPIPGNFVRDALGLGYKFGFIGSGDSHDGHPGLAHLANGGTGGLAAIIADELTRPAILEAIRNRRVYATSGPRIYLRAALSSFRMGSTVPHEKLVGADEPAPLYVHAIGTGEIAWLDVVRSGQVVRSKVDAPSLEVVLPVEALRPGEYIYLRIVQADGGLAWSSPIYIE